MKISIILSWFFCSENLPIWPTTNVSELILYWFRTLFLDVALNEKRSVSIPLLIITVSSKWFEPNNHLVASSEHESLFFVIKFTIGLKRVLIIGEYPFPLWLWVMTSIPNNKLNG